MRFVRLSHYLEAFRQVDELYYEEVNHHAGTAAAHIYGGIVAVIQAFCEERSIPYSGIPVGTVKKYATGKGNANKAAMVRAARALGIDTDNDNEADAIFVALAGWEGLG